MSATPPGFLAATRLLLRTALRRQRGRMRMHAKTTGNPAVLFVFLLAMIGLMYWAIAGAYLRLAGTATQVSLERASVLVTREPLDYHQSNLDWYEEDRVAAQAALDAFEQAPRPDGKTDDDETAEIDEWRASLDEANTGIAQTTQRLNQAIDKTAVELAAKRGGTAASWRADIEQRLAEPDTPRIATLRDAVRPWSTVGSAMITALLVLWWIGTALASGEGAIDALRRRHPMWEWYATLPIRPAAPFVAEALAPALVNPGVLATPMLFVSIATVTHDSWLAGVAMIPIALPLILVGVVWSKVVEVVVMLRATPRNRGTWFSVLGMLSFLALFAPLFVIGAPAFARGCIEPLLPLLAYVPGALILFDVDSIAGWAKAMAISLGLCAVLAPPAFACLRFAVARGIEGGFGRETIESGADAFAAPRAGRLRWLDDPLLRKDLLWLRRDRSAWLQMLLFPALLATLWLLVFDGDARQALSWHQAAGLLAGFGGYLLFAGGPRALASESAALGVALAWPRPLEDVLRARIRVVFVLIGAIVAFGFALLLWNYPESTIGIVAVAASWTVFAHLLAEKSITLMRATGESGDTEAPSMLRGFIPGLGNFAFAVGVYQAQWQLVVAAVVLNIVLATALWQDFRHRLPYLFDAQSEPQPTPPTVLNSVIAIVGLLELAAVVSIPLLAATGADNAMFAQAVGYAVASIGVFAMTVAWYARRGAGLRRLLTLDEGARYAPPVACAAAIALGVAFGVLAHGYLALLHALPLPALHEQLNESAKFLINMPEARFYLAIMAVALAPWIEEFLFRGLLFRALLGESGAIRAIVVSSALFAILHPWPFWPVIFAIGAVNALIYQRSRALLPCVLLHFTYNALVLLVV